MKWIKERKAEIILKDLCFLYDTLIYLYNVMNNNNNNNSEFQREKKMVILTFALYEISRFIML